MRITSKARSFISLLMKHLKFALVIPPESLGPVLHTLGNNTLVWEAKTSKIFAEYHTLGILHGQVKEKSYLSSFYFWAIRGSDVTSQPF